jgi:SecD/SecF fusion protein
MKTYLIIVAIIIAAFSSEGCTTKENFDFKITLAPETKNTVVTPDVMNKVAEIISKRLNNSLGIPKENIKLDANESQISLTISNVDTSKIASVKETITGYASLEFWETYENSEIMGYLTKANNLLREMKIVPVVKYGNTRDEFISQNPLFGRLKPMITELGEPFRSCLIGLASETDTAKVNEYLLTPQIKALFPTELKLMWSQNPYEYGPSKGLYALHAIKATTVDGKAPLDGSVVISARTVTGSSKSDIRIDLTMNDEGTIKWAGITRRNMNRCIAVVLNGYVRSYPRVQAEISGGNTEITGDFTVDEANELVNIFKSGELPLKLKIVEEHLIRMK